MLKPVNPIQIRPVGSQSVYECLARVLVKMEIENLNKIPGGYGSGDNFQLQWFKANELLKRTHAAKFGTRFDEKNARHKSSF